MSKSLSRLVRQVWIFRGTVAGSSNTVAAAGAIAAPSQGRHFTSGGGRWLQKSPMLMSSANKSGSSSLTDPSLEFATGLEREELEAELRGEHRFDVDPPRGPFGTKEAPAIIPSHFDERIVGCSGGVGEDEHDVVWFRLKKGQDYECPVCTQFFQLNTIGEGGRPGGHH